jgi:hypothetical protein
MCTPGLRKAFWIVIMYLKVFTLSFGGVMVLNHLVEAFLTQLVVSILGLSSPSFFFSWFGHSCRFLCSLYCLESLSMMVLSCRDLVEICSPFPWSECRSYFVAFNFLFHGSLCELCFPCARMLDFMYLFFLYVRSSQDFPIRILKFFIVLCYSFILFALDLKG